MYFVCILYVLKMYVSVSCAYVHVLYVLCMYLPPSTFGCKKYIQYIQYNKNMHTDTYKYIFHTYNTYTYGLTSIHMWYVLVCMMYVYLSNTYLIHTNTFFYVSKTYVYVLNVSACLHLHLHQCCKFSLEVNTRH